MLNYYVYTKEIADFSISDSFFIGWPNPPSSETHKKILAESYRAIICVDDETSTIIGFINAVSDGILSAYIPLLEVIPSYQGRGVGKQLVSMMLKELSDLYMVDLLCDPHLQSYYEKLGMIPSQGMVLRNYERQNGTIQKNFNTVELADKLAHVTNIEVSKEELRQLEKQFCEDVATLGAIGWSKYFAKSGRMLTKNGVPIEGKEAIKNAMTPFFELENLNFFWEPTHIEVSNDATLAVTYGNYKRTYILESEKIEEAGMYMTVWTKNHTGKWQISADVGN